MTPQGNTITASSRELEAMLREHRLLSTLTKIELRRSFSQLRVTHTFPAVQRLYDRFKRYHLTQLKNLVPSVNSD